MERIRDGEIGMYWIMIASTSLLNTTHIKYASDVPSASCLRGHVMNTPPTVVSYLIRL